MAEWRGQPAANRMCWPVEVVLAVKQQGMQAAETCRCSPVPIFPDVILGKRHELYHPACKPHTHMPGSQWRRKAAHSKEGRRNCRAGK